jgi:predicted DNA-binding protein YlxM (UPF0122 family)
METWQIIVAVCAGLITIFTLFEKVWKYTRPVAKADEELKELAKDVPIMKSAISDHGKRLDNIDQLQVNDVKALRDHTQANRVVCNALLALLDHELSGNHTEQLVEAKEKINTYLIER